MCDYCNGVDDRLEDRLDRLIKDWSRFNQEKWSVASVLDALEEVLQCDEDVRGIKFPASMAKEGVQCLFQ